MPWLPVTDEEATSAIGEGLHTGLRKGTDAPEAPALWEAISASSTAWSEALDFLVWGLHHMGYAVCKEHDTPE